MSSLKEMVEKEPSEPTNPIGTVIIGNLEPDMHDTAKEMVRKSLKKASFKTIDLGKNVSAATFVAKAKEVNANIIALSINMVAAKENLQKLASMLEAEGLKGKVGIIIGGAAVKSEDAEKIGAVYGKTREEAVALAKQLIEKKK
jgi:methanogenic corrinoid protein MtbC1